ncbi:hypothetical protein [Aestuariibaculum lutulentum]|uniref:Uncharacterized protein n=1 Tax=Aestuariibaculum lutulentum TaxID=2920935 RepID=A0ABS9RHS1_9FLAO|nr:hypothetical protein [Aestuariibaculum lutulentum]MCH4551749.1 hypothetical protein [Aestuariibaculum lutulentum]
MKRKYNNIEEVRFDLKVHALERQIALEKMKQSGYELKEVISMPSNLVSSVFSNKYVKILALIRLLRKVF